MRENINIENILNNSHSLTSLSQKFAVMDKLNLILKQLLPIHLTPHCHIGAIDDDKNLVILYLANPALRHIIIGMANLILENFNQHHFSFAGIITRISPHNNIDKIQLKSIDPQIKNKLKLLATSINRIDLIDDAVLSDTQKEIDF